MALFGIEAKLVDDGALPLPTARVHVARASRLRMFAFAAVLVAASVAVSTLLHRIDTARAWADVARSEARLARAEARQAAIVHRDVKPVNDPRVEVCVRRTEALRSAIFALVRTGHVAMPGDPGWEWASWR